MNYFIILRGSLGVGKTTIAKKLAQILNGNYISIDEILEKNGLDKVAPDAECIPAENFIKAQEIILPEAKNKLEHGGIVIFDACFYHKEQIEHLIGNLPFSNFIFTLKAPLEICIKRDKERQKTLGQESAEAVYNLVSRFDYGKIINTENKSADQVIKEIISYLPQK